MSSHKAPRQIQEFFCFGGKKAGASAFTSHEQSVMFTEALKQNFEENQVMYNRLFRCVAALALLVFASAALADPRGGPQSGTARAPAYGETVHRIVYNGGEQADFSIVGDGDTTLNLVVEDAAGNVIVRTRGAGDRCHVSWSPARTATYFIYVVNEGSVYNKYRWHAY